MSKRLISLCLVLALLTSLCTACSKPTDNEPNGDELNSKDNEGEVTKDKDEGEKTLDNVPDYMEATGYPIVKEEITIRALGRRDATSPEWNEMVLFQKVEELTNIRFEFELAESAAIYNEKKNLAFATGNYPDVFMRSAVTIREEEKYGPEGVFIDLKPYIDDYAPNLKKRMAEHPEIESAITAMDGNIYGLPAYIRTSTQNPWICYMNAEWLDRVGKTMPETVDDFYELLKAYKTQDANGNGDPNDEIPFGGTGLGPFNFILASFTGLAGGMTFDVKEDGTVVYTPLIPEFKEFLIFANRLYKEELVDPEIFSQSGEDNQKKAQSGIVGIYNVSPTSLPAETTDRQDCLEPLTSEFNDKKVAPAYQAVIPGAAVITNQCEYPEALMRWFDIWYAKEDEGVEGLDGNALFLGFKDEHWEYADPKNETYRWIEPVTSFQTLRNENKVTENTGLPEYLNFMPYPADFPLMEMKVKATQTRQEPYMIPTYPRTARYEDEIFERIAELEGEINPYVNQTVIKFITGEEPIENYDNFVSTIQGMGIDELKEIKQDGYNRWAGTSK